ncbi:MAG: adenosylhomocysteinase [Candidatus Micrarchaeia archaeon]
MQRKRYEGTAKIELAQERMGILSILAKSYKDTQPFEGIRIGMCLHITKETAVLCRTLVSGGAQLYLCASNPLSTQDDVADALRQNGINVYGYSGESINTYWKHIDAVASKNLNIVMDDGGDLTVRMHTHHKERLGHVIGGCEETTTGVNRLRAMESKMALKFPVIAVNNNITKRMIDNYYGTGQSTIDGILRSTNILLSGKTFVVCGYGPCGKGVAMRAKGMGANVVVCEVNPINALQAYLDGYRVMRMEDAAKVGDIFVTVTGDINVIRYEHMLKMKDGAILANSGHFDVEIDVKTLNEKAVKKERVRHMLDRYLLPNGRRIYLCAEGRLVNLAAGEGHPSEVMATSFAGQCLAVKYLLENKGMLENRVYELPIELDMKIAAMQLDAFGVKIDRKTREQEEYKHKWK